MSSRLFVDEAHSAFKDGLYHYQPGVVLPKEYGLTVLHTRSPHGRSCLEIHFQEREDFIFIGVDDTQEYPRMGIYANTPALYDQVLTGMQFYTHKIPRWNELLHQFQDSQKQSPGVTGHRMWLKDYETRTQELANHFHDLAIVLLCISPYESHKQIATLK
jgi:hypothetical protein